MPDARRRELERGQGPQAEAEALGARLRAGEFDLADLGLLSYFEVPGARALQEQIEPGAAPPVTWAEELADLRLLSLAPIPERFWIGRRPQRLRRGVWSCAWAAADRVRPATLEGDAEFRAGRLREGVVAALTDEALAGVEGAGDLGTVLVTLAQGDRWLGLGRAPLELQAFPPLCRILGVEVVRARFQAACLSAIFGEG